MLPKLNVTLVGAGHYARDLIYPKYKENPNCNVKATISPHSSIPGVPAFKTVDEWIVANGMPGPDEVFDLCVFADDLVDLIILLSNIGARNFILPKPIAEDYRSLNMLVAANTFYKYNAVVASQWFYSPGFFSMLRGFRHRNIRLCYGQRFENKRYNVFNSFLPHALQICYALDVNEAGKIYTKQDGAARLFVTVNDMTRIVEIEIDLASKSNYRYVEIEGVEEKFSLNGYEDNLKTMADSVVGHFRGCLLKPIMMLDYYFPIARRYLELKEACQ